MTRPLFIAALLAGCVTTPPDDAPPTSDPTTTSPPTTAVSWEVEVFAQANPKVDVLVVVDNSMSMRSFNADLPTLAQPLQDRLEDWFIDYHVGVVSTDMWNVDHQGRLRGDGVTRWSTRATDPVASSLALQLTLEEGTQAARGAAAADRALDALNQPGEYNAGFHRAQAAIHVVFLAISDDWSDAPVVASWLTGVVGPNSSLVVSAVTAPGTPYASYDPSGSGQFLALATPGWDAVFDALDPGDPVADGELVLAGSTPDLATLVVELAVDGMWQALPSTEWAWDPALGGVRLDASHQAPFGAHYRVSYLPPGLPATAVIGEPPGPVAEVAEPEPAVVPPPPVTLPQPVFQPCAQPYGPEVDWDDCERASVDPSYLDSFQQPGQITFCHSSGGVNFVLTATSISSCVTHAAHACDVYSTTGC